MLTGNVFASTRQEVRRGDWRNLRNEGLLLFHKFYSDVKAMGIGPDRHVAFMEERRVTYRILF